MLGIELSIRDYRDLLIKQMPGWMELNDPDLLNYFSLSGFDYFEKEGVIVVDGTEYDRFEWTLGDFKTDLGIAGTGNYDDCIIDIIENIDSDDNVFIYTNPNYIMLDSMATIIKKKDDRRNLLITEMNPYLATVDGLLLFWEAMFQSTRGVIDAVPETDAEYMARVISLLFGASTSLVVVRAVFERLGLINFTIEDSRKDTFKWNLKAEAMSVNLHMQQADIGKIPLIKNVFLNITLAGMRLFIFVDGIGYASSYGASYGNS
jgi:hypothetical protein